MRRLLVFALLLLLAVPALAAQPKGFRGRFKIQNRGLSDHAFRLEGRQFPDVLVFSAFVRVPPRGTAAFTGLPEGMDLSIDVDYGADGIFDETVELFLLRSDRLRILP